MMMKFFTLFAVVLCVLVLSAQAAPSPGRGEQILDAHTAIQKIIAAYNRYPGPSVVHPPEIATLIDPNTFVPNIHL